MPYRFVPPVAPLVPPTVRVNHPGHTLFRHYAPWQAGLNVFLLTDGTVTTVEPGDPSLIDTTFHGGHIHTVEEGVAGALVAAGYTVQFVSVELPAPGLPGGDYASTPGTLSDVYSDTYLDGYGVISVAAPNTYTDTYLGAY